MTKYEAYEVDGIDMSYILHEIISDDPAVIIDGGRNRKSINIDFLEKMEEDAEVENVEINTYQDVVKFLNRNGGRWSYFKHCGYSQGDEIMILYNSEKIKMYDVMYYADIYNGCYRVYSIDDVTYIVTDSQQDSTRGDIKKCLSEMSGLDVSKVFIICGYISVPRFEEVIS